MKGILRVLLIEDSEPDARLIVRELQRGYEVSHRRVETPEDLNAAMAGCLWDVVLCDHSMARLPPLSAHKEVKRVLGDVPFIVVSGTMDERSATSMLEAGASDVLQKDQLNRLLPTVRRELACIELRKNWQADEPEAPIEQAELALISQALTSSVHGREPSLWSLLAGLATTFKAEVATFFTLDSRGEPLVPTLWWRAKKPELNRYILETISLSFQLDQTLGLAWQSAQPHFVEELEHEPGFQRTKPATDSGLRRGMWIPITRAGRFRGVIELLGAELVKPSEPLLRVLSELVDPVVQLLERLHTLEEQSRSDARFRLLVDGIEDQSLVLLDHNGVISAWNSGAQRATGYSASQMLGQNVARMFAEPEVLADTPGVLLATASATGRAELDVAQQRRNGSCYWAKVVVIPIRDGEQILGYAYRASEQHSLERLEVQYKSPPTARPAPPATGNGVT